MEIIQFEKLFKGKAHARKDKVNSSFKKSSDGKICLMNMETRETMTMDAATAKERFTHKIDLRSAKGGHPAELLYFQWVKDDDLPF